MFAKYRSEFSINLKIALPIIIGQLGHVLVGFVDNIMVGKLGDVALATVSLANSFIFIGLSIGIGFGLSISPQIAEAKGKKDVALGGELFLNAKVLSLLIGLLIWLLLWLSKPLMTALDQPPPVVDNISPYYDILAFSMVPLFLFQCYKQFSDGLSLTIYAMVVSLVGNLMNVLCNYLLIYGHWGLPEMGVTGAGLGTLIARIFMYLMMVVIVHRLKIFSPYLRFFKSINIRLKTCLQMLKIGYATALQVLFEVSIFAATILLSGQIGIKAQASNQIGLNLATMTFMVFSALGITASIRVGHYKGLKDIAMIKKVTYAILLQLLFLDTIFALFFVGFRDILPTFYIDDPLIIATTAQVLLIAALFQFADSLQVVLLGVLRGFQDVIKPIWITFLGYWLIGFPICYALGLHTDLGIQGIWIGLLIALVTVAGLLYKRFKYLVNLTF